MDYPAGIRINNPHEKKLAARTICGYFIGYLEKYKEYKFYGPTHNTRIVEMGNILFIENDENSGSKDPKM